MCEFYFEEGANYLSSQGLADRFVIGSPVTSGADAPANFSECLFQLQIKQEYIVAQEYALACNRHKLRNGTIRGDNDNLSPTAAKELAGLEDALNLEQKRNQEKLKKSLGNPLLYGDIIQLFHVQSSKFVSVSPRPAIVKRGAMRVEIDAGYGSKSCFFEILPMFKHRRIGETINVGDQVSFLSIEFQTFINGSVTVISGHQRGTEISASLTKSGWKALRYAEYNPSAFQFLQAGDTFRLFHSEQERYVSSDEMKSVVLRSNSSNHQVIGSNDLWRLAFASNEGGIACWGAQFRIQHVASGRYLAAGETKDAKKTMLLLQDSPSRTCTFKMFSTVPSWNAASIPRHATVQIKHSLSGQYLQCEKSDVSPEQEIPLALFHDLDKGNAFTLRLADPGEVSVLTFILGMVSLLSSSVNFLEGKEAILELRQIAAVSKTLQELVGFLERINLQHESNDGGRNGVRNWRAMLRDQRVLEYVVRLIRAILRRIPGKKILLPEHENALTLVMVAYQIVILSMQECRENQKYLSQWGKLFQEHADFLDIAQEALLVMLANNFELLSGPLPLSIERAVDMVAIAKSALHIRFLQALCVCDTVPILSMQNLVSSALFRDTHKDSIKVILTFGDAESVTYNSRDGPVTLLAEQLMLPENHNIKKYISCLIHLLATLCKGRTVENTVKVSELYPYQTVVDCFRSSHLPGSIRGAFGELLLHAYIDAEPLELQKPISYVRAWDDLDKVSCSKDAYFKDAFEKHAGNFGSVRNFIIQTLARFEGVLTISNVEDNKFFLSAARIARSMMEFGLFDYREMESLFAIFCRIMDGRTDRWSESGRSEWNRYRMGKEHLVVAELKVEAMHGIHFLWELRVNYRVTRLLEHHYKWYSEHDGEAPHFWCTTHAFQELFPQRGTIFSRGEGIDESGVIFGLLDSTLYESLQVQEEAWTLLWHYFHQRTRVLQTIKDTKYLISDMAKQTYIFATITVKNLRKFAEEAHRWYSESAIEDKLAEHLGKIDFLSDQLVRQKLPTQDRLSMDIAPKQMLLPNGGAVAVVSSGLEKSEFDMSRYFSKLCANLKYSNDSLYNVNHHNQGIARRISIHEDFVSIIAVMEPTAELACARDGILPPSAILRFLNSCYCFLTAFSFKNQLNQEALLKHVDLFLRDFKRGCNVLPLLTYLYASNPNAILAVEESIIKTILSNYSRLQLLPHEVFLFLRCLLFAEEKVCPRNQTLIGRIFLNERRNDLQLFISSPEFQELCKSKDAASDESGKLYYHLQVLKLLPILIKGDHIENEIASRDAIPIEHIIKIIRGKDVTFLVYEAYLMLFYSLYVARGNLEEYGLGSELFLLTMSLAADLEVATSYLSDSLDLNAVHRFQTSMPAKEVLEVALFESLVPCLSALLTKYQAQILTADAENDEALQGFIKTVCGAARTQLSSGENAESMKLLVVQTANVASRYMHGNHSLQLHVADTIEYLSENIMYRQNKSRPKLQRGSSFAASSFEADRVQENLEGFAIHIAAENDVSADAESDGLVDILLRPSLEFHAEDAANSFFAKIKEFRLAHKLTLDQHTLSLRLVVIRNLVDLTLAKFTPFDNHRTSETLAILSAMLPNAKEDSEYFEDNSEKRQSIFALRQLVVQGGGIKLIQRCVSECRDSATVLDALNLGILLLDGGEKTSQVAFMDEFRLDPNSNFFEALYSRIQLACDEVRMRAERSSIAIDEDINILSGMAVGIGRQSEFSHDVLIEGADSVTDTSHILEVLYFLQQLCEGHYLETQEFLREQTGTRKSFDLVTASVGFLSSILGGPQRFATNLIDSDRNWKYLEQAFDTIIEFCQGPCRGNQDAVLATKILEMIDRCLWSDMSFIHDEERVLLLKGKAIDLVLSLLEGRSKIEELQQLSRDLSFRELEETLRKCLSFAAACKATDSTLSNMYIELGHRIYMLAEYFSVVNPALRKLLQDSAAQTQNSGGSANTVDEAAGLSLHPMEKLATQGPLSARNRKTGNDGRSFHFFQSRTGHVEILRDSSLETAHFRLPDECRYLTKEIREDFVWHVDRSTPNSKIEEFQSTIRDLIIYMKWHRILSSVPPVAFFVRLHRPIRNFAYFLAVLLNLAILLLFWRPVAEDDILPVYPWQRRHFMDRAEEYVNNSFLLRDVLGVTINLWLMFLVLAVMHVLCSFQLVASLMIRDAFVIMRRRWSNHLEQRNTLLKALRGMILLTSDWSVIYIYLYLMFSLAGLLISPFFFVFHLFDIIPRSRILHHVIMAITKPARPLAMTCILGIIIIYTFTVIAYVFLRSAYVIDSDGEGSYSTCDSVFQCMLVTAAEGLTHGGGIAEFLDPKNYQESNVFTAMFGLRYFFDILFFVVVFIVLLNIIFGIIVDTFGELRAIRNRTEEEMKDFCFICSLSRYTLDHEGSGFTNHTRNEHRMWNYLFYLLYIQSKPVYDLTGLETYVYEKYRKRDPSWFPVGRAQCVEQCVK